MSKLLMQTGARKLITKHNPHSIVSEQYKTIRTNIKFSMYENRLQTLLFTSALRGEGKSTTAANTAISFAQEGQKVVVVDADMRIPTMHYTFRISNSIGLSSILSGQMDVKGALNKTDIKDLYLITCGLIPPNPAELLGSKYTSQLMIKLKSMFDVIIFDGPPLLSVTDAQILSNKCDGTILVINSGKTKKENVFKAKEVLRNSKANIIGTVLNNTKLKKDSSYYQYYGVK